MNKLFAIIVAILITTSMSAQAPQKMTYQAVIRNYSDQLVTNQVIGMKISILQNSTTGTVVYSETQTPATNANGLVSIEIGTGTLDSGDFTIIDWANGSYFIKTETDPTGGANYTITGISQLLSVPYALHAKTAESIEGGINETDPLYNAWDKSTGINITESQITDLQTYLTTEVDGSITNELQNLSEVAAINNSVNTQLKNVTNPTDTHDAATKLYVDQIMQIMENNGLTVVDFTASSTTTSVGSNITFTDTSAINPITWYWDFGDGNTSTTQNPSHAYTTAGTYTVSLTASNGVLSNTESKTNYIAVANAVTVTDLDGNIYPTVTIGTQRWLAENLKTTKYNDGTEIPNVTDSTAWANINTPAYCWYNNDAPTNKDVYGALYNRYTVETGNLCPIGWHVPTDEEWKQLEMYLGMSQTEADGTYWRGTNEGSQLAGNIALWNNGNLENNAEFGTSGFTALPSGSRSIGGSFRSVGDYGYWWSTTDSGSHYTLRRALTYNHADVNRLGSNKEYGFSVRCVED